MLTVPDPPVVATPYTGAPIKYWAATLQDLDAQQIHDLYRLRIDVFVTEQACRFEFDDRDPQSNTVHLLAIEEGRIIGTARDYVDELARGRIGRVAVAADRRKYGIGRQIMNQAISIFRPQYPERPSANMRQLSGAQKYIAQLCTAAQGEIFIEAQSYLRQWYESYGFKVCGEQFMEAGILHYPMLLEQ